MAIIRTMYPEKKQKCQFDFEAESKKRAERMIKDYDRRVKQSLQKPKPNKK